MSFFRSLRRLHKTPKSGEIHGGWAEIAWAQSGADLYSHHFVALQPILNRHRRIFGYEALFRSGWENRFVGDPDLATQAMIDHWLLHGLDQLVSDSRTFVNCTRSSLTGMSLTLLPTSVVLELLETIEPDKEVLAACRKLKALGYQIALDDFQLSEKTDELLAVTDYVKVDFRISDKGQRRDVLRRLKKSGVTLVAEKIEAKEEYETAVAEGFHLFQGYYLARPALFAKRKIALNEMNHFRLAEALA